MTTNRHNQRLNRGLLFSIILSVLIAVPVSGAVADTARMDWQYAKAISLHPDRNSNYHSVMLDEDVYAGANNNLSDLRIVDKQGEFVSYYLDSGYEQVVELNEEYASALVHTAQIELDTIYDYSITPLKTNTDIVGNALWLSLPNEDFLKHIEVMGSYDGVQWQPLVKDDLYRAAEAVKHTIQLGDTYKFNYYRLIVHDNVERLAFDELRLMHNTSETMEQSYIQSVSPSYDVEEAGRFTHITIHKNNRLKLKQLQLDIQGNFSRSYSVNGAEGQLLQVAGDDTLYQLSFKDIQIANTTINFARQSGERSYTVKIDNADNAPLQVKGITAQYYRDKLVFEDKGNGPYRLLYGNSLAEKPQYDIIQFKAYIEQESLAEAKLGVQTIEKASTGSPQSAQWYQSKGWFNAVIVVVSLILIGFLVINMNRTRQK